MIVLRHLGASSLRLLGTAGFPRNRFEAVPSAARLGKAMSALRGDTVELHDSPLAGLALSQPTLNALSRGHITEVGQVLVLSDEDLLEIRNFNEKCLTELDGRLAERNLKRGQ